MRLITGLLIVLGLVGIAVALAGVRQVDATVHAARLATRATAHSPTTAADIEARLDKLKQTKRVLDEATAKAGTNETLFLGGMTCVAVGIAILLTPPLLGVVKSTAMTSKEREGKR